MPREEISLFNSTKGIVRIYSIDKKGNRKKLLVKKNAIQANAAKLLVRSIGVQPAYNIDTIGVYKLSALLAASTDLTIEFPVGDNSVIFRAIFNQPSFNDTLDELRLSSAFGGVFSIITGLSILKDDESSIEVEWEITISNLQNS